MINLTCLNSENWFWCRVASSESNFERRSSRSSCCAVARLFSSASVITTPFLHQTRMYRYYACLRNFCRNGLAKLRHLSLQIFFFVKHFLLNSQILLLARYNSCTRESNVKMYACSIFDLWKIQPPKEYAKRSIIKCQKK